VLREIGERIVDEGLPGGTRFYAHAYVFLDLKAGSETQEVNVALQRGATVKGCAVAPDGHPVENALVFSRIILKSPFGTWKVWLSRDRESVRHGRFELHGLDTDTEVPVFFLEPKHKLGATVNFSGKLGAAGPVTVRLEPCGAARARLVNPGGRPVVTRLLPRMARMLVTPGPPFSLAKEKEGHVFADEGALDQIDPLNYGNGLMSDAEGRIKLPVLIPGATYRIVDITTTRDPAGPQLRREFTVKPGETLDLGDILIEKPLVR